jgi:two-component system, cell cycle response regulator
MTAVARRLFVLRRRVTSRWATFVLLATWPLLAAGFFGPDLWRGALGPLSAVAVLGGALSWAVLRETSTRATGKDGIWTELELGLLLATSTYVLLAVTGGLRSFLYPLVYALVSFSMIVHRRWWVGAGVLVATAGLEVLSASPSSDPHRVSLVATHLTFIGFFAAGNLLVLSGVVRRLRGEHTRRLAQELESMRQEARDFRLIASQLPLRSRARSRDDEESRMTHAAVQGIHEQLFHTLDLLRTSLGLHTCALLWCQEQGHDPTTSEGARRMPHLVVKELATGSELALERPELPSAGVLTSVLTDPKPLRLEKLAGKRLPPYYAGPEPVSDLCAVPVLDGLVLRGILCADRIDGRPFEDDELRVLQSASEHVLRIIAHERTFLAVERSKYEQEQFYKASEMLNEALTLEEVYGRSADAVRAITDYDLLVISGTTSGNRQRVLSVDVRGAQASWKAIGEQLEDRELSEQGSMISMALKNRHFMPATGEFLDPDVVVFDAQTRLKVARSLLVLPLTRGDRILGALTLASSKPHQYPAQTREMLRVISHQVGVSLQNARMYQSMEHRASTDGLTGLTNHRAFQERLTQIHALAERTGQKYALILTDIDHFKSINDTYGHPVGDQVLKRVAALFSGRARKVDLVARYGGEEFVLVLPDTDGAGAEHFANEVREEMSSMPMTSEHGTFKITISMGISEFPADGSCRLGLIEKADQALYHCKEHGRNRVQRWSKG